MKDLAGLLCWCKESRHPSFDDISCPTEQKWLSVHTQRHKSDVVTSPFITHTIHLRLQSHRL